MSITSLDRRVVVLLPQRDTADNETALFDAASQLAGSTAQTLNVIELGHAGRAPAPAALRGPATWWHAALPTATHASGNSLVDAAHRALVASGLLDGDAPLLVLLPPGPAGNDIAARLAVRLDAAALGGCSQLTLDGGVVIAHRSGWGGRIDMVLRSEQRLCTATLRAGTSAAAGERSLPEVRPLTLDTPVAATLQVTPVALTDAMPPLEGASLVVSGGRGMGGDAGFGLLREIAEHLGASLGGSLPTVDAGWVPVARQIGQSGKFVSPRVYFAVGISGTPQHLAGVSTEAPIIAVNKDPDAHIFKVATAGVVAEWGELLPLVLTQLKAMPAVAKR